MSSETEPQHFDSVQKIAFQMRRNQILEDIYDAYKTPQLDHEVGEALKREFNNLSDQLECLYNGPMTDPLRFLPPELWMEIIRDATKGVGITTPSMDALLVLTLVSEDWRTTLTSTPGLWTDITIGKREADTQAKLKTILWLSKNLDFTLRINIPPVQWVDTMLLLQPHVSRIKQIVFVPQLQEGPDTAKAAEFLHDLFPSLGHLPSLKIIQGRIPPPAKLDWHDIFMNAPNLRRVHALHTTAVPFEVVRARALRACTIETQSYDFLQNLKDIRHIEELSWNVVEDTKAYRGVDLVPSLPALKRLYSYKILNSNIFLLLKLTTNITTLGISIMDNWRYLYDFFNLFEHLPHLQVLALYLHAILEEVSLPPMTFIQTPLRDLNIVHYPNYSKDASHAAKKPSLDALYNLFPIYFPNLRSLDVTFIAWDLTLASYITSLSHLWSLRLSYISGDPNVSINSPSLQDLILEGSTDVPLLSLMVNAKCPSLSKLKLTAGAEIETHVSQPYQERDCLQETPLVYVTTETLDIGSIQARWEIHKFNALKKLQVGGREVRSSGFLVSLILEPHYCPALAEIELLFIPEWDLLFLMLERRNYLPPSQGVAQIKTITLPSPIPPALLAPLVDILSGRFTRRPSNTNISFSGFMEEYFDQTIPGCEICLISMMPCNRPTSKAPEARYRQRLFHKIHLPAEQVRVPVDVWEWLRSREDRRSAWTAREDAWMKGGLRRYEMCNEMELAQRPFSVTCYSVSDLLVRPGPPIQL